MTLQDQLRAAVQSSDTPKVQDVLDRIARQYFENSMRRIRAAKQS